MRHYACSRATNPTCHGRCSILIEADMGLESLLGRVEERSGQTQEREAWRDEIRR